jgi:hypothetical protein
MVIQVKIKLYWIYRQKKLAVFKFHYFGNPLGSGKATKVSWLVGFMPFQ